MRLRNTLFSTNNSSSASNNNGDTQNASQTNNTSNNTSTPNTTNNDNPITNNTNNDKRDSESGGSSNKGSNDHTSNNTNTSNNDNLTQQAEQQQIRSQAQTYISAVENETDETKKLDNMVEAIKNSGKIRVDKENHPEESSKYESYEEEVARKDKEKFRQSQVGKIENLVKENNLSEININISDTQTKTD